MPRRSRESCASDGVGGRPGSVNFAAFFVPCATFLFPSPHRVRVCSYPIANGGTNSLDYALCPNAARRADEQCAEDDARAEKCTGDRCHWLFLRSVFIIGTMGGNAGRNFTGVGRVSIPCERGDSNPHGLLHWILSPARLPVPPLPQAFKLAIGARQTIVSRRGTVASASTGPRPDIRI